MKNLTYRELLSMINKLTPEQLNMTATVYDGVNDEFLPINAIETPDTDVLDNNHPVFIV